MTVPFTIQKKKLATQQLTELPIEATHTKLMGGSRPYSALKGVIHIEELKTMLYEIHPNIAIVPILWGCGSITTEKK